jgi:hypothetical protein
MKELIYQDEKVIQKEIDSRIELNNTIIEFMSFLINRGVNAKKEHVISFMDHGIPYIHQLLLDDAKKEIKRLKINSVGIQNNMLAGIEKQADDFQNIFNGISEKRNKCGGISIDEISFQENKPIISDSDIEQIKEKYSIYLYNEDQEKIWKLQKEFAKAFNQFENGLKEFGLPSVIYYGKPEKLDDVLIFKLKKGVEVAKYGMEEMRGFPRSGNVIIEPNPDVHKSF